MRIIMKYIICLIFLLLAFKSYSQKHDYNWMLGYDSQGFPEGILFNFNKNPISIKTNAKPTNMYLTTSSYSDSQGTFWVYTDGCRIANYKDSIISDGDNINFGGPIFRDFCGGNEGYPISQGALFLPHPDKNKRDSVVYLIHERIDNVSSDPLLWEAAIVDFAYTEIVRRPSLKQGFVAKKKNQILIKDTLSWGRITACKHSDGNSWWILKNKRYSNKYYTFLLDTSGFRLTSNQDIGNNTIRRGNGGGQACFTPNGEKYLSYSPHDGLFIFDFNRSTGNLSNFKLVKILLDSSLFGGVAVSPNNQFAYVSTAFKVYQYDLKSQDIKASEKIVAEYDGFLAPFPTYFWSMQLGSDCRIYLLPFNGASVMHYIRYPNKEGIACEVVQHGITFPNGASNSGSLPNFPNYRLGITPTYPCDSTIKLATPTMDIKLPTVNFLVYPNPANSEVSIKFETENQKKGMISIINIMGQMMLRKPIDNEQLLKVDVSAFPNGIYTVLLRIDNGLIESSKFSVLK
jgi:Secretion system C-terminal sorting domain